MERACDARLLTAHPVGKRGVRERPPVFSVSSEARSGFILVLLPRTGRRPFGRIAS